MDANLMFVLTKEKEELNAELHNLEAQYKREKESLLEKLQMNERQLVILKSSLDFDAVKKAEALIKVTGLPEAFSSTDDPKDGYYSLLLKLRSAVLNNTFGNEYFYLKNYAHWVHQMGTCPKGMCPSYGNIVLRIERIPVSKEDPYPDFTEEEQGALFYYIDLLSSKESVDILFKEDWHEA